MSGEQNSPADVFSVLSNPIRIQILTVLMEEDGASFETAAIPFSEIYERVDIKDSGQLNYHLSKLTGHFIQKTEAGYGFRHAGRKIVWAIRAGAVTGDVEQTLEAPGSCYACGQETLIAQTRNNWLRIVCSACETPHTANPFPAGGISDRSAERTLNAFDRIVRARLSLAANRVCIECTSEMTVRVSKETPEDWDIDAVLLYRCQHCGYWLTVPFGMVLLDHPQVSRFYRNHGFDPDQRPYWDISVCVNDELTAVVSEDPWRIQVETAVQEASFRAEMDASGDLVTFVTNSSQ